MSFYKTLSAWAEGMEIRRLENKREKSSKKLTFALFANTMAAHEGAIATLFELSGSITVQRLSEAVAKQISDAISVLVEAVNNKTEELQNWFEHTYKLYDNSLAAWFKADNAANESRHKEMAERQEETNGAIFGLFEYLKAKEHNDSGRYLAMQEELRRIQMDNEARHAVTIKTVVALFENLTWQLQSIKKRQIERIPGPTIPWLMERAEELMALGSSLRVLQDNSAPPQMATVEVVKSIRALTDHSVSITDIRDALDDKVRAWGVAA